MWTAVQSAVIWGIALVLVPVMIVAIEAKLGMAGFDFPGRPVIAVVLLVLSSALNLLTGSILASRGEGTPLPLACPRALVMTGPYRIVRNPMAVAGIGQGIGVALLLGSWLVLVYALLGAIAWHVLIRPAEEHDLLTRFGHPYEEYRRVVPLWRPRIGSSKPTRRAPEPSNR
jgi:protein-S-isoprenylcysteine O-methyltransferase Ste14